MAPIDPVVFEVEPAQTASTWPVMRQLRPHLDRDAAIVEPDPTPTVSLRLDKGGSLPFSLPKPPRRSP